MTLAATITTDGKVFVDDAPLNNAWLQEQIGGYYERVAWNDDIAILGDEDGLPKEREPNPLATALALAIDPRRLVISDFVVGDVVVVGSGGEDWLELPSCWVAIFDQMAMAVPPIEGDLIISESHTAFHVSRVGSEGIVDTFPRYMAAALAADAMRHDHQRIWKQRDGGGLSRLT